jgi:hypothetical protein
VVIVSVASGTLMRVWMAAGEVTQVDHGLREARPGSPHVFKAGRNRIQLSPYPRRGASWEEESGEWESEAREEGQRPTGGPCCRLLLACCTRSLPLVPPLNSDQIKPACVALSASTLDSREER